MEILETRSLKKTYHSRTGPVEAVKGVSFSIHAGEILGYLGPNGAGKTTTIKMICGLVRRDEGLVRVVGLDPQTNAEGLAHLGAVLEGNRNLYWRLTVEENLEYFGVLKGLRPRVARQRGAELIKRFDLQAKRGTPVRQLSRGMQQKAALAVALVHQPRLLLLDEPTLGLDVEAAENVKSLIREIAAEGRAVLLTTHQLGVAEELSHRIVIINQGQVIVEEATGDLIRRFSGEAYRVEVQGDLDPERVGRLERLGAWVKDGRVEFLGTASGLYQVLDVLNPLPLVRVEKDQANLTAIFLKLVQEADSV